jgi:hypothetical protein
MQGLVVEASTTIDMEPLAGDETAILGGKEQAHATHLLDISHTTDGLQSGDALQSSFRIGQT